MKKRIMALLLALCMLLSICVPVAVADEEHVSVPACDCWLKYSDYAEDIALSAHGVISGHCSRKAFADGELTQSAAYLAKHWDEYPADVITYLTEKLQSDYASKYEEVLRLRKIADCRPKPKANDLHVSVGGYTPSVEINGTNIYMDQYAKVALTAADGATWQIQLTDDTWTDITGAGSSLTVNYGLAASLLDANNCINLRAYGTYVDNGAECRAYSDVFTVRFKLNGEDAARQASIAAVSQLDADEATASTSTPATTTSIPVDAPAPLANEATVGTLAPVPVFAAPLDAARDGEGQGATTTAAPAGDSPAPNAEGDVKATYNVVINYKFENNEIVSDPYTANLAEGSSFSATVTFPTVQGYLPYVGETQQNSIELNYASVTADVTINVVYKPTNVDYTVIHYQQNVENDQYTVAATETKQGLTASQVPEVAKEYEGFYSLIYERPAIAADGSTVIEVYYDRYYYLLNFDMDGGYGTDPVYARYGASIGTVNTPTKAGYSFGGWSETKGETDASKAVTLPTTMPAENKTYHAIWTAVDTAKVTVVFWGENADDEGYSYLADQTKVINLKPGREFTYSENEMLVCDREVHTHTADCINCGKTEHTHTAVGGSCYTLTCTQDAHTHGTNCYAGVGSRQNVYIGLPDNPQDGQVYHHRYYDNLIYIKGSWYKYSGSTASGSIAPTTCGKAESTHTHNNTCYTLTCTTEVHTHDQKCYTCGKEQHTHNSDCYMQGAGLDSRLWKFVKSDTITVAADGSSVVNVYYDRTEFTLTFRDDRSTVATIKAKWGQDISGEFNKAPFNTTYDGRAWKCTETSKYSYALQTLDRMPQFDATFDLYNKSSNTLKTIYYYVENVGANVSHTTWPSNQTNFTLLKKVTTYFNYATYDEEYHEIEGFTRYSKNVSGFVNADQKNFSNNTLYLYYLRNDYTLTFNDGYSDVASHQVQYQAPLNTYSTYVPDVPAAYEPGSVTFGGWYLNPQCTGEEYKLSEKTMPLGNLILYAKWVPVNRTVKFYLTESSTEVYKPATAETEASFTIPHGDNIAEEYVKNHLEKSAMNEAKPNGDYTFVMWYYYENGEKKPFDPTMQIRKDLTLYGEWSSNTLKNYTVQFVLKDDHSVKVADDMTGSGLAGTTKTFDAKGGTDLYAAYQEGYFPTVQSQSLLLDIESNSLVVTFEYVPMPAVPYTVKYVEKDTGKSLADDKVVSDNRKAVVTETFKAISGYMPDAYQKRLVVTADGENVLYFYYTKDTEHAYYKITHYIQNTDGTTWTDYASSQVIGDIGTRYTASPMTIPGYTYKETKYVVNGTEVTDVTAEGAKLTENGLEINLYYVRNEYPYQVRYLEQGTGKVLHEPKNGTGKYGQVISESAIDIDGYDKVAPTSATLNIRIDEGEGAPNLNIITFYYKEKEVTINYVAVGPTGAANFGSINPTTETVKEKSGTAQGSTPTAGTGYKFVGWYKDEDCTQPVDASWVTDNKIVPQKDSNGKNVAATYYAKFEADTFDLTITKEMATGSELYSSNDSFIFHVAGPDGFSMDVVVHGEDSVTIKGLKAGTYTVTEDTGWSWRYEPATGETLTTDGKYQKTVPTPTLNSTSGGLEASVTFTNKLENNKWLGEQTSCENYWTGDKKELIKQNPVYPIQKKEEVEGDPNANLDDDDDLIIWPR